MGIMESILLHLKVLTLIHIYVYRFETKLSHPHPLQHVQKSQYSDNSHESFPWNVIFPLQMEDVANEKKVSIPGASLYSWHIFSQAHFIYKIHLCALKLEHYAY